jgi:hypothetical protein
VHLRRWIIFGGAILLPSCFVYNQELIDSANGGSEGSGGKQDGSGGKASGGDQGDGDGDGDSGGMNMGGAASGGDTNSGGDSGGGNSGGTNTGSTGGGNSGGTGSGGSGSGGGPVVLGCDVPDGLTLDLVDDMRLASNHILASNGRKGDWLGFHGTDMETVPVAEATGAWPSTPMSERPDDTGNYALHYTSTKVGSTSSQVWQQFGFLLNDGKAYDMSEYDGIVFCAKRDATSIQSLNLRVTTYAADPADEEPFEITGQIIPSSWSLVKIPFDTAWPTSTLSNAKNIEFIGGNGIEYDIWIDDIALYSEN